MHCDMTVYNLSFSQGSIHLISWFNQVISCTGQVVTVHMSNTALKHVGSVLTDVSVLCTNVSSVHCSVHPHHKKTLSLFSQVRFFWFYWPMFGDFCLHHNTMDVKSWTWLHMSTCHPDELGDPLNKPLQPQKAQTFHHTVIQRVTE